MKKFLLLLFVACVNILSAQQVCFSPPSNYVAGTTPFTLTKADFNNDGILDIAVGNNGSNNVSILLGNGTGGFGTPSNFGTSGTNPWSITSADFNANGAVDIAVSCNGSNVIARLLGTGTGSFGTATTYTTGPAYAPYGITNGDFNGDTKIDLATADGSANNISVWLGTGSGTFGTVTTFTVNNTKPWGIINKDFNGDGKLDLVTANYGSSGAGNTISIYIGTGTGSFGTATNFTVGTGPRYITTDDFNGDGKWDIATSNVTSNDISVLLGTGTGSFSLATNYSIGSSVGGVTSGDFNGDLNSDLAVSYNLSGSSDSVVVLTGNGAGSFSTPIKFITGSAPGEILSGDFNGDSKTDLAMVSGFGVSVLLNGAPASISGSLSICQGNSTVLTVNGATTYTWSSNAGSANTQTVVVSPTSNTTYSVNVTYGTCTGTAMATVTVNPLPTVTANATSTIICTGTSVTLTGGGASTYSWTGGVTNGVAFTPTVTQTYTVSGTNSNGCINSATKTITVNPLPNVTASASPSNIACAGSPIILNGGGANTYTWTGGVTNGVSFPAPSSTQSYTVTGTDVNNCTNSSSITINIGGSAPMPYICMVSTDSLSKNNIIYWEKSLYPQADSFIVYRYDGFSTYLRIGAVSKDSFSIFTDTARSIGGPNGGDPQYSSYRYKLAMRYACGSIGPLSPYHETSFLQDQLNGNFNWNAYAIESGQANPVTGYSFSRDDNNTGTWNVLVNTSGLSTTDPNYFTYQNIANWRVDAITFNCTPTLRLGNNGAQATVVKSRSNVKNNRQFSINSLGANNNVVKIYPNPANNELTVSLSKNCNNCHIQITNVLGKIIKNISVTNTENKINIGDLESGVYVVKVNSNSNSYLQKLVVQH